MTARNHLRPDPLFKDMTNLEKPMKKFIIALPMIAALAACEAGNPNQGALTGAALGAAAGAAVSGSNDRVAGALIGGAAGAAAGNYIGRTQAGNCIYQRPDGSRYSAACP